MEDMETPMREPLSRSGGGAGALERRRGGARKGRGRDRGDANDAREGCEGDWRGTRALFTAGKNTGQ